MPVMYCSPSLAPSVQAALVCWAWALATDATNSVAATPDNTCRVVRFITDLRMKGDSTTVLQSYRVLRSPAVAVGSLPGRGHDLATSGTHADAARSPRPRTGASPSRWACALTREVRAAPRCWMSVMLVRNRWSAARAARLR